MKKAEIEGLQRELRHQKAWNATIEEKLEAMEAERNFYRRVVRELLNFLSHPRPTEYSPESGSF